MKFPSPLQQGTLLRRYKRFFADVRDADGKEFTLHCPNPGSMLGCSDVGSGCAYSLRPPGHTAKLPGTLELVNVKDTWVGVNPLLANTLFAENYRQLPELADATELRREQRSGESRLDFVLQGPRGRCWIEVKSVSLRQGEKAAFPDARSTRALKHVQELCALKDKGERVALCFVVQRSDCESFCPAEDIDPAYAQALRNAIKQHRIETYALRFKCAKDGIVFEKTIPVFV